MKANLQKIISKYEKFITTGYTLNVSNMTEIHDSLNGDIFEIIITAFKFGFGQGMKCQKAKMKKKR